MPRNYQRTAGALTSGIADFFRGGGRAEQAGAMSGLQQIALEDQIVQRRAAAERDAQEAQLRAPDAITKRVLMGLGVPTDLAPLAEEYQRTGKIGAWSPDAPANAGVGAPTLPRGLSLDVLGKFGRDAQAEQRVLAGTAKSLEDALKAPGVSARSDLTSAIASGALAPEVGGRRVAGIDGKPLYNADANGAVLDVFRGALNEGGDMSRAVTGLRVAQAGAERAQANQRNASADTDRARASNIRAGAAPGGAGSRAGAEPARGGATSAAKPVPPPKMPAEVQRMNIALRSLDEGLVAYENKLKNFNTRSFDQANPESRAEIESLVGDLRLQLKEAQALGALTGPDMAMLDQMLASPTSARGAMFGNAGLAKQLQEVRASLQRRKNALAAEFNLPSAAPAPAAPAPAGKQVVRTGMLGGRKVVQYSDGTTDYAD